MKYKNFLIILITTLMVNFPTFAQLGSVSTDAMFIPVPPCRVMDTRSGFMGFQKFSAGETRPSRITFAGMNGNFTISGGSPTNCNLPNSPGIASAVALNITVVSPTTSGYITLFPYNTARPLAATLNFNAGDVRGNFAVVQSYQSYSVSNSIQIYSTSVTDLVIDVVGYYTSAITTALECVDNTPTNMTIVNGGTGSLTALACPTGHSSLGTFCSSSDANMPITSIAANSCTAKNYGTSATLTAQQRCCRVPGR